MNTIQLELLELIASIQKFQNKYPPLGTNIHIDFNGKDSATVAVHGCTDHAMGLEVKRLLGVEDAEKAIFDPTSPWHVMRGELNENVYLNIFCRGLPPMCRIESYEEEIPKEQVVTLAETVKVKRTRICCGEGE